MKRLLLIGLAVSLAIPAQAAQLPTVERITLDNGLTVMLREDHAVPLVSLDPDGKEGLADLTATVMKYGTKRRTEKQIDDEIALLGASLYTAAASETFYVGGSVPTIEEGAFGSLLEIMADVLLNPTFPAEGAQRALNRRMGQLQGLPDNWPGWPSCRRCTATTPTRAPPTAPSSPWAA
jgi:zinc protease